MDIGLQILVGRVIGNAWRQIREIPWDEYGKGIRLINSESGAKKYQGLMVMHAPRRSDFISTMTLGELADPGMSFMVVRAKIASLEEENHVLCSIELRNPPQVWGGAVRMDCGDLWGVSGLPEVVDHVFVTLVLHALDILIDEERDEYLKFSNPGVAAALAHVDMDHRSYESLIARIGEIVRFAARQA